MPCVQVENCERLLERLLKLSLSQVVEIVAPKLCSRAPPCRSSDGVGHCKFDIECHSDESFLGDWRKQYVVVTRSQWRNRT